VRKNVLVRNPVVSLDNMSVFANRARQEKIVKNPVCCFYSSVVMEFLSDTLVVTALYVS